MLLKGPFNLYMLSVQSFGGQARRKETTWKTKA
jgi:hypothetical protein